MGPAKSTCILTQGFPGHSHGCTDESGGTAVIAGQLPQLWTYDSISESSLGHQRTLLAIDFILTIPGWLSCNNSNTGSRPRLGMITRVPHNTQPCSIDI